MQSLLNFLLFQGAWFAAILGGANGWPILGALPALGVVALHLWLNQQQLWRESVLIAAVTVLGFFIEGGFMAAGLLVFTGTEPGQIAPPVWIVALWFAFATLPNASLSWLKGRWRLQAVLGAIAGPLAYVGGAKLGATTVAEPTHLSVFAIGLAWGLALPVIFQLAEHLTPRTAEV